MMKQILIATHGKMASGIRYTAEMIVGKMAGITAIDAYVTPEDNVEEQFEAYFREHAEDRIIVFTDIMGGSVNQRLMKYADRPNVTLITGTNLAVLIQVLIAGDDVDEAMVREFVSAARQELQVVSLGQEEPAAGKQETSGDSAEQKAAEEKEKAPEPTEKKGETPESVYKNSAARIAALRVDDRLIHGQVAMTWTKQLRVQGILVANDDAAGDNTQKMALKMAAPAGIRVLVEPVDRAIRVLNDPRASKMRILVLTKNIRDALQVRKQTGEIEFLNIGNAGRFDGVDISEKQVLTSTIMLTEAEVECLKELVKLDPGTCMQQVPNDEQKLVKDVLAKLG